MREPRRTDSAAAVEAGAPRVGQEGRARHRKAQPLGRHRCLSAPRADRQHRRRAAGRRQMGADDLDLQRRIVVAGRGEIRRVARHGSAPPAVAVGPPGVSSRSAASGAGAGRPARHSAHWAPASARRWRGAAARNAAHRTGRAAHRPPPAGRAAPPHRRPPCSAASRAPSVRAVQRVLEGAIQRVELAERLAPEVRQEIEGAIGRRSPNAAPGHRTAGRPCGRRAAGRSAPRCRHGPAGWRARSADTAIFSSTVGPLAGAFLAHHREDRRPPRTSRRRRPRPARGARVVHRRSDGKLRPVPAFYAWPSSAASGGALVSTRTAPAGSN